MMKFSLIVCTYMRPEALLKLLNSVKKLENELQTNGNSLILSYSPKTLKPKLFPLSYGDSYENRRVEGFIRRGTSGGLC